ncbi:peptidoglycan DD-metalloendopeptidase family protein [Microbacterium sp. 179-B 1A2 NHS]|uniref:peptidoglycan DD-metalloendopeptidase family protein n=1 Tax=Microbacterium sp. 179-B 1A2 NHS TaxID=3142383 RepID=UPI0039A3303D
MSRSPLRRVSWSTGIAGLALVVALAAVTPAVAASSSTPTPRASTSPAATPSASPSPTATPTVSPTPTPPPLKSFTTAPKPALTGTPTMGQTLRVKAGTWKPTATVRYQWRVNGAAVSGATGTSWRLPASAVGKKVTVSVTGKRTGYKTKTVTSAATAAVSAATFTRSTLTLKGERSVGKTLTAVPGSWGPQPLKITYQWLRDGAAIPGATARTYVPVAADDKRMLSVRMWAKKSGFTTARKTSAEVRIARAFTTRPVPTITGTVAVGKTLTATSTAWKPAASALTYRWYRGSAPISGATRSTYKLVAADGGKAISVRIRASRSGYTPVTRASATVSVPRVLTAPATVTAKGTRTVGSVLTAEPGAWGPSPVTLEYRWLRDGRSIPNATGKKYTLTDADGATSVSVRVTARKTGYTTQHRTSVPAEVKWAFTSAPTPKISGSARAGSTLTATVGTWKPAPAAVKVRWRVDGAAVAGATGTTWTVPAWAAGRAVTVSVTATRADFQTVVKTSSAKTVSRLLGATIEPGTSMRAGVAVDSPSGEYRFGLLGDGNVALSDGTTPLRTARTTGTLDGMLHFTGEGELQLRDGDDELVWSSRTAGRGVVALTLGDDGALRLLNEEGTSLWTSASLRAFTDTTAATGSTPGRYGWAYPIRPSAKFTTYTGHSGDDIAAKSGTPIYAMRGGSVTVREPWITSGCPSWAPNRTRQKEVVITSKIDGSTIVQVYAHLSTFSVKSGQTVKAGQKIGEVGSTGCSTGPHLHTAFTVDGVRYALYPRDVLGVSSY